MVRRSIVPRGVVSAALDRFSGVHPDSPQVAPSALARITRRGSLCLAAALFPVSTAHAQTKLEKADVTIGVGPGWGAGGHAAIALHKGYFKEAGFRNVELKFFPAGMMQLEAMVSGAVDVSNPAHAPVLTLRSNGLPVTVLANLALADRTTALVMRKAAGVKSPKQLEGLKIGLLKGSPAEQMMLALSKAYGVDAKKIQFVNLPPPAQLSSLSSGAIDGIAVWQPWVHQAQQKADVEVVHTGTTSHFESNKGQEQRVDHTRTVLATTEDFVRRNPHTVDALLRAYVKAQAFIADPKNFDEMVDIYSRHFKEDPALNRIILKDHGSTLALSRGYYADLEAARDFLQSTGRLRRDVSIEELTRSAPLAKIDPALVDPPSK